MSIGALTKFSINNDVTILGSDRFESEYVKRENVAEKVVSEDRR